MVKLKMPFYSLQQSVLLRENLIHYKHKFANVLLSVSNLCQARYMENCSAGEKCSNTSDL